VLSDIGNLAGYIPAKVGECSERMTIVNSAEENRTHFCKHLDGKPLFSALYVMYAVALNELKTVLKLATQAGQSGGVNKTSVESTAQNDDFREVKTHKRRYSDDTSQTAKKSTISIPKSADFRLPTKAVTTRNLFAPLKTNNTETTGAEDPQKIG
jgi:hypothetical protein